MAGTAIVLFNLGGPDKPASVRPFLFNLFNDSAIIPLPTPFRWLLARYISGRRAPVAREIYARIGGRSPLLELTRAQATALEVELGGAYRAFVAMRYWHPLTAATVTEVTAYQPDRIVLLPLYPQYSSTTSGSSLAEWDKAARQGGLTAPTAAVCCYPTAEGWIAALTELVRGELADVQAGRPPRVLFSAHGLPKSVIAGGDPYQLQVERTVDAVVAALGVDGLDWTICYQSRVGRQEWIGPSTDDELRRAGRDGVPVVVVPVAFVSEHSETLVELDIEYRHLAETVGVPAYVRVPAVGTHPRFIGALAELVRGAETVDGPRSGGTAGGERLCPKACGRCPNQRGPAR